MKTITQTLSDIHTDCDKIFAHTEAQVAQAQWHEDTLRVFEQFVHAMEQHFAMEEQVLFPAFEEKTGQVTTGPTAVMRLEHQQMRALFEAMRASLQQQDQEQYLGLSETLLILMRQHNAKEEQILYPMSDQLLADQRAELLAQVSTLQ